MFDNMLIPSRTFFKFSCFKKYFLKDFYKYLFIIILKNYLFILIGG